MVNSGRIFTTPRVKIHMLYSQRHLNSNQLQQLQKKIIQGQFNWSPFCLVWIMHDLLHGESNAKLH